MAAGLVAGKPFTDSGLTFAHSQTAALSLSGTPGVNPHAECPLIVTKLLREAFKGSTASREMGPRVAEHRQMLTRLAMKCCF